MVLSFCLIVCFFFRFKPKKVFILKEFRGKIFVSRKVILFCLAGLFLPNLCSNKLKHKLRGELLESSLKNKSWSYLLEEICWPPDGKSLSLRRGAFEMLLSHGAWRSPLNRSLLPALKQFLIWSEIVVKRSFTIGKFHGVILCKWKNVCLGSYISLLKLKNTF